MKNKQYNKKRDRKNNEMRLVSVDVDFMKNSSGSCLISYGNTKVICSASVEEKVPRWLRGKKSGWITAEYSMLPTATNTRTERESVKGKQSGRTQEIQRLIGRSIRSSCDLQTLGERQIKIDCDVISADGGTRTAAITGSWIALAITIKNLINSNILKKNPLRYKIAAISCGIVNNEILLDLDYNEDSNADVDANFVFTDRKELIEIQCTGEKNSFSIKELLNMTDYANTACNSLFKIQENILNDYFNYD